VLKKSRYEVQGLIDAYTGHGSLRISQLASDLLRDGIQPISNKVAQDLLDELTDARVVRIEKGSVFWWDDYLGPDPTPIGPYQGVLKSLENHPAILSIVSAMKNNKNSSLSSLRSSKLSDPLEEHLVRLGKVRKDLRPHIRPILAEMRQANPDFQQRAKALESMMARTLQPFKVRLVEAAEGWSMVHFSVSHADRDPIMFSFTGVTPGAKSLTLVVVDGLDAQDKVLFRDSLKYQSEDIERMARALVSKALKSFKVKTVMVPWTY